MISVQRHDKTNGDFKEKQYPIKVEEESLPASHLCTVGRILMGYSSVSSWSAPS